MTFNVNESYLYKDIVRIYKETHLGQKELTRGGFLNPAKGKADTLIRAIFAREHKNGPLPNILFVSGDSPHRHYNDRIEKTINEKKSFLYFNEQNGKWIYQGESRVLTLIEPGTKDSVSLLNSMGYSLIQVGSENGVPLWQLFNDKMELFNKERKVEFIAVVDTELSPIYIDESYKTVIGRVSKSTANKRLDQVSFSKKVNALYGNRCVITGSKKIRRSQFVQACHINAERDFGNNFIDNSPLNGILLRADLHALFDDGLLTIDNQTGIVIFETEELQILYSKYNNKICRSWTMFSDYTKNALLKRIC